MCTSSCSTVSTLDSWSQIQATPIRESLYADLLPKGFVSAPIVFSWFKDWDNLRFPMAALPAVRAGLDVVALPRCNVMEKHWARYSRLMGLQPWQAVFFDSRVLGEVAQEVAERLPYQVRASDAFYYPRYRTDEITAAATSFHGVLGDNQDHALCRLSEAKSWLHPLIGAPGKSSLREHVPRELAKGPYGYIAQSRDELREALRVLRQERPHSKWVLKPTNTAGGVGVVLNASESDVEAFKFKEGRSAILEELIEGRGELESPTLYMIGNTPCGFLGDQLLVGPESHGNRWPAYHFSETLMQSCFKAATAVQQVWQLQCAWCLDFVVDACGDPVIVDINLGRPIGNFGMRLWESARETRLFLHTESYFLPLDGSDGLSKADVFWAALERANLLWSEDRLAGVIPVQCLPGCEEASCTIASASGWDAVDELVKQFRLVVAEVVMEDCRA